MKRILALISVTALMVALLAMPAQAARNQQNGLVNVNIGDVNVQVPVAVAANVCGVSVNVLAQDFAGTDDVACEADANAMALVPPQFQP